MADERPVLLFGSANVDIVGRALEPLGAGTSSEGWIRITMGGVARNVAEVLARLGQETILVAAVGDDEYGTLLGTSAAEKGIDTSNMLLVPEGRTGSYIGLVDQDGRLVHGLSDLSLATAITPDVVHGVQDLFDEVGLVVMDMNLPPVTIETVLALAEAAGVPVAADPTSRALAQRLKPHLARLYFVAGNIGEVDMLCGAGCAQDDREGAIAAAQQLLQHGVEMAAVTMAEFGVGYAGENGFGYVPAIRSRVVNQTGAGDAFMGTALFGLLNDIPLDEAVQLGVAAASLTLQSPYTVLPNLSLDLLYEHLA